MKKYFYKLPHFIKVIFINLYSLLLINKRYTKGFFDSLNYYKSIDRIEENQLNEKKYLEQISDNPYFKNINFEDCSIIDKQVVKKHYYEIINKDHVKSYLHTSGTTGSGLKFPVSQEFIDNQWAVFWKFRNIHGINLDTWCLYIIGQTIFNVESKKPPFWIKSYPTKQLLFSQYHLNEYTVETYLDQMIQSKIKWMHAYPSVLNNLANLIKNDDLEYKVKSLKLDVITTSSEKLFSYQRENIENIFGCKVRELYGLTEGVVNIFECEYGTLHIDESYSYVELIQKENSNEYMIIGTSYYNKAFPLVRYKTGDTCLLYDGSFKCSCGRKSRIVKEILGRDEDYLILKDGTKIGRLDHLFKGMTEVDEAQIFQKKAGKAIFKIVKGKNYNEKSEIKLFNEIKEKLGRDFIYEFEYLTLIPKTKRGKLKFVVSEVNE